MMFKNDDLKWFQQDAKKSKTVHIHKHQRTGKKFITSIEGLPANTNFIKLCKFLKKKVAANAYIQDSPEFGKVICVQGNCSSTIVDTLAEKNICLREDIVIHNF